MNLKEEGGKEAVKGRRRKEIKARRKKIRKRKKGRNEDEGKKGKERRK